MKKIFYFILTAVTVVLASCGGNDSEVKNFSVNVLTNEIRNNRSNANEIRNNRSNANEIRNNRSNANEIRNNRSTVER